MKCVGSCPVHLQRNQVLCAQVVQGSRQHRKEIHFPGIINRGERRKGVRELRMMLGRLTNDYFLFWLNWFKLSLSPPPSLQEVIKLYHVNFIPELIYKQGTCCTSYGCLIQRSQGIHIHSNRSSETLALLPRQGKVQALLGTKGNSLRPMHEKPGPDWRGLRGQPSPCMSWKRAASLRSKKWNPDPDCPSGPLGISFWPGKDAAIVSIPATGQLQEWCVVLFIRKKCQTPKKIPRTMIVTHDKTEHVKFFWLLGLGCWCIILWDFLFHPLRKLCFFTNNTNF